MKRTAWAPWRMWLLLVATWMAWERLVVLSWMGAVDGGVGGRIRVSGWEVGVREDWPMQWKRFSQSSLCRRRIDRWQKRQESSKMTRCGGVFTYGRGYMAEEISVASFG